MTSTDAPDTTRTLATLRQLVVDHYVLESDIAAIAACLAETTEDLNTAGPEALARLLTERLQRTNHDGHLRVRHRPAGAASSFGGEEYARSYAEAAVRNAGGIRRVTRLDDVTGLLEIAPYTSPVHLAAPYVEAAFALLAGVRRLVVDLRAGRGGTPETVALICGHLLGDEPVHLQDVVQRHGPAQQFWSMPAARRLLDDVSVHVLTSAGTFSGCEELAYDLQALGRATVVGETTRGGAHPVEAFRLTDVLEAHVPVAMSVNAVTGTNWEQVGVVPDVACPAAEALERALSPGQSCAQVAVGATT